MNKSTVITITGIVGVFATTALTAQATYKVTKQIETLKAEKQRQLTKKEIFKVAWKPYVAPTAVLVSTVAAIASGKIIDMKAQASLTASLVAARSMYGKYRGQIQRLVGLEDEKKALLDATKEQIEEDEKNGLIKVKPVDDLREIYHLGCGVDGGYFKALPKQIDYAEMKLNQIIHERGEASLADFLDYIPGVKPNDEALIYGWGFQEFSNILMKGWINVEDCLTTLDDGLQVHVLDFSLSPVAGWDEEECCYDGDYPELDEHHYMPECNRIADHVDEVHKTFDAQKVQAL